MFGLIPIDKIDISILRYLKHELKIIFDREIKTLPAVKIQKCAYNNLRKQYNARTILESNILDFKKEIVDKILAIIDRDLYSPELNFVFGEVDRIGGRKAIISITRLREEFYNQAPNKNLFFKRILKEAIHELGHLCGITHCGNPKCVMYFSNSLLDTDNKSENFCRVCQIVLKSKK
jgi:archaemetzincin